MGRKSNIPGRKGESSMFVNRQFQYRIRSESEGSDQLTFTIKYGDPKVIFFGRFSKVGVAVALL
jgi:hypothetical protein